MPNLGVTTPYYGGGQVPSPANVILVKTAPANNLATAPGLIAVDYVGGNFYVSTNKHVWAQGGGVSGPIDTLTGSSGGAISPSTGNINLLGTANQITTTGSGSTITWTLPSAITAPGSLTTTTSLAATTSVTAGTTVTATLGAITATNGNLVLGTAGNKIVSTSVASTTAAGANAFGKVTLVGGTATVSTTAVTASSIIILTRQGIGATGAAALGGLTIGTISAGVSFVINAVQAADATALQASDVSSIGWMIIN